ncbi:DUF397 domain-containing protein [Streptomyces alkaliphilus]|uniref:DUF397 domain-containing protein n=1 Tax=Streptomyces alkaliphilus TaxID=1472722 RepID=UPI00117C00F7|nr:DUF397 domain-containing protein [Streptomyces alkaliphilus]MQS06913.1 DUF397 domain-containing protein [Streptomyces alkaliphilus]
MLAQGSNWTRSSHSGANGECVEIRRGADRVGVRDSKRPTGPHTRVPTEAWTAFLHHLTRN